MLKPDIFKPILVSLEALKLMNTFGDSKLIFLRVVSHHATTSCRSAITKPVVLQQYEHSLVPLAEQMH